MWWDERNKRRETGRRCTPTEVYMAAAYAQNFLKTPEGGLLPDNRQKPK